MWDRDLVGVLCTKGLHSGVFVLERGGAFVTRHEVDGFYW